MIEIEEPPDIRACATHSVPLVWHFSARAQRWKAWEPVEEDPELMRRHRCEHHGDPAPTWRDQRVFDPDTFSRGLAKARDAIGGAAVIDARILGETTEQRIEGENPS